jgi:hypothetical protein
MNNKLVACCFVLVFALAGIGLNNVAYADPEIDHCGIGDVTAFAEAGQVPTPPLTETNNNCQARLYDDNGPAVPHVWCEEDLFLLGIWMFGNYQYLGIDRWTAAEFLEQHTNQVLWTSAAGTTDVEVIRSATKDTVHPSFGHLILIHDYVVFGNEPLPPGDYMWEWVSKHPLYVEPGNPEGIVGVGAGEVEIVSHQEHLSRVAAGTW